MSSQGLKDEGGYAIVDKLKGKGISFIKLLMPTNHIEAGYATKD